MRISEAAVESGLSTDTIRFYEAEGLIGPIARGRDGNRVFGAADLRWLHLFARLRATNMPLSEMRRYAGLARQGDASLAERRMMLEAHGMRLDAQETHIHACRDLIRRKIATYRALEAEASETTA